MNGSATLFAECSLTQSVTLTDTKIETTGHQMRSGVAVTVGDRHVARSGLEMSALSEEVAPHDSFLDEAAVGLLADTLTGNNAAADEALCEHVSTLARRLTPFGLGWLRIVWEQKNVFAKGPHGGGTRRHRLIALVASSAGPNGQRHRFVLDPMDPDQTFDAVESWIRHLDGRHAPPTADPLELPLVFDTDAAAILLHELIGHPLESDLADDANLAPMQRFAPAGLSAQINSPLLGAQGVDCEGTPLLPCTVLDRGRIISLLSDLTHSGEGRQQTASGFRQDYTYRAIPRMHSMAFFPGQSGIDPCYLLHDIKSGVHIKRLRSGTFNPLAQNVVLPVEEAFEITNGKLGRPLGSFVLSGDARQMRHAISAIGSDVTPCLQIDRCVKVGQCITVRHAAPTLRLDPIRNAT